MGITNLRYLELEISGQANKVSSQRGALIYPHETHCFSSQSKNQFLVLDVMPTHQYWMKSIDIPSFWELTSSMQKYLQFAGDYLSLQKNSEVANEIVKDFLFKLLSQNFLSYIDPRVLIAKNWIDAHFSAPINIKALAKHCYLSASQLQRRFKRCMSQGIGEYWRSVRLKQAQILLKTHAGSIEVIAQLVGYECLSVFSRSFSRMYNMSPSEWRDAAKCKK